MTPSNFHQSYDFQTVGAVQFSNAALSQALKPCNQARSLLSNAVHEALFAWYRLNRASLILSPNSIPGGILGTCSSAHGDGWGAHTQDHVHCVCGHRPRLVRGLCTIRQEAGPVGTASTADVEVQLCDAWIHGVRYWCCTTTGC